MQRLRPLTILLLLTAFAVALPAAVALGQSAGDEQYQDPLAGGGGGSGSGGQQNPGGSNSAAPSTPSTPPQPSSGSTGSSAGGNSAPAQSTPSTGAGSSGQVPLARTGFDAWIPAVAGAILLAGGALLLLRTRREPSRR